MHVIYEGMLIQCNFNNCYITSQKKVRKLREVSMFNLQNIRSQMPSLLWENINWSDTKYADLAYF